MKKFAVIVAGGSGQRMGASSPKQFLRLGGKAVLWHTLRVFLDAYSDLSIILVLPEEHMETGRSLADAMGAGDRIRSVAGGATRFVSVKNGLALIREGSGDEESLIFVHDGVRCLLTADLIRRCYEGAMEFGSAIPVIDSKDSVRLLTAAGNEAIERSRVKLVQTPQTFLSKLLLPAYAALDYNEKFTDEATVVEAGGAIRVHLVEGEGHNIKITTTEDMLLAEEILKGRALNIKN